jgi:uncharacterized protein (TIGR02217 family)
MADFTDEVFPEDVSDGATGGPEFSTVIITASSGNEQRVQQWERPRRRWNVSHGLRTPEEMSLLVAFFLGVKGKATGFRFRDPSDYEATDEPLSGVGGTRQLTKEYTFGSLTTSRDITKPAPATVTLKRNGVAYTDFTLDTSTGIVTLVGLTTGTFTWSGEFHVPARFDTDSFRLNMEEFGIRNWEEIIVLELMDE